MGNEKHPADDIGRALLRAGGILSSLTICYNKEQSCFELEDSFVFEALSALETMLSHAGDALGRLYSGYDLSPLPTSEELSATEGPKTEPVPVETTAGSAEAEKAQTVAVEVMAAEPTAVEAGPQTAAPADKVAEEPEDAAEPSPLQMGYFPSSEQVQRLSQKLDSIIASLQSKTPPARDEQAEDDRAKSYLEFLDKLTAMADSAAVEASRAGKQDKSLLPILDSLRADVMRLREVA